MVSKTTLITSLLWLVALTTTNPSNSVEAFVLATERPNRSTVTSSSVTTWNKEPLQALTTIAPSPGDAMPLFSTLADVEMDTSTSSRGIEDLLPSEGRVEEILDLSKSPLLLIPKAADQGLAKIPEEEEVLEWAGRYTSVEALREHFGTNQNKLWGDLQASTARRLYKTLLPRALLELSKLGKVQPQDLAPLAYQARVAAKMYARERCTVPARIAATLFDGFRQWIKYGKFQAHGMTYDQLWEKYAEKILLETESEHVLPKPDVMHHAFHHHGGEDDDDEECDPFHSDCEELSEMVCRKILERACASNEGVDALALEGQDWADDTQLQPDQRQLLERIRAQLEQDMYQLLLPPGVDHPKAELPALPVRYGDRFFKQGKFRLVKGLARQRRFWKLKSDAVRKELEANDKRWTMPRPKPWLSRSSKLHERDDDTDSDTDTEDNDEDAE